MQASSVRARWRRVVVSVLSGVALGGALVSPVVATTSPRELEWQRFEPPSMEGAYLDAGAANRGRLIVVGQMPDRTAATGGRAAIWITSDARSWDEVSLRRAADAGLTAVTAWRGGFVAVGWRDTVDATGTWGHRAAIFVSGDGRRWQERVPGDAVDGILNAVTVHDGQLVAGGCTMTFSWPPDFEFRQEAALWTSKDGLHWTRRLLADGDASCVQGVASTGTRLLAVGGELDSMPEEDYVLFWPVAEAIWRGRTPAHMTRLPSLDEAEARDVIGFRGRDVVVGEGTAWVRIWRRDHAGWALLGGTEELAAEEGSLITAVGAYDGWLYATGMDLTSEYGAPAPLWTSHDGVRWHRSTLAPGRPGVTYSGGDVLTWRGRLVLVGTGQREDALFGAVWIARPDR